MYSFYKGHVCCRVVYFGFFLIKENSAILNVQTPHPSAAKDISHDSSFPMSFLLVIDSR